VVGANKIFFYLTFSDGIWQHLCCPVVTMHYNVMSVITDV